MTAPTVPAPCRTARTLTFKYTVWAFHQWLRIWSTELFWSSRLKYLKRPDCEKAWITSSLEISQSSRVLEVGHTKMEVFRTTLENPGLFFISLSKTWSVIWLVKVEKAKHCPSKSHFSVSPDFQKFSFWGWKSLTQSPMSVINVLAVLEQNPVKWFSVKWAKLHYSFTNGLDNINLLRQITPWSKISQTLSQSEVKVIFSLNIKTRWEKTHPSSFPC